MANCIVILHDIRSTYNVGSIFRTADGAGVEKIYLTGYTPVPVDRFGRKRKDIAKVALGAEESVEWEKREDIFQLIDELKKEGIQVVAVEQDSESVSYRDFKGEGEVAFIFGNEVGGLSREICDATDLIVEIPMRGQKESLNVSVTAGIVLFSNP